MTPILTVVLLLLAIMLIGIVLIQRSEGGALGLGGPSGFMTARGSASFMTRLTAILAALFIATSLALAVVSGAGRKASSVMEAATPQAEPGVAEEVAPGVPEVPEAAGQLLVIPEEGTESWMPEEVEAPVLPRAAEPASEAPAPAREIPESGAVVPFVPSAE